MALRLELSKEDKMALRINTNIAAYNAYRNLSTTDSMLSKSLERLSSGLRINRAADDAAGLAISESLKSQVNGFKVALNNAQDGISLVQTAEGAMSEVQVLLQRVRDLTVQASNTGANDQTSRDAIGQEVTQALAEIDRISSATVYGSKQLLVSTTQTFTFQVGYNGNSYNQVAATVSGVSTGVLSLGSANLVGIITGTSASNALTLIDAAITAISVSRTTLGALQNRFTATIDNLGVAVENLASAQSRITDTDMASEMTQFTRNQILEQAGTAMLAQANLSAQNILSLLK
jgi:flagellin